MTDNYQKKTVAICDTQPITAEGLRCLLGSSEDLEFKQSLTSLESASSFLQAQSCDIAILDKGFGMRAVLDWIHDLKLGDGAPTLVVWGVSMTEAEAALKAANVPVETLTCPGIGHSIDGPGLQRGGQFLLRVLS